MSWGNQPAVWLPFLLAAILVMTALIGSHLSPLMRRRVGMFLFEPLWVIGMIWLVASDLAKSNYVHAALLGISGLIGGLWVHRRFQAPHTDGGASA